MNESYQTFGPTAFTLFLSRWLETPLVFLVVALLVSIVRRAGVLPPHLIKPAAITSFGFFILALIVGVVCFFIARYTYKTQGFCLSADALKIRKGIFTKEETAIPYRQIQNVSIERTLANQMFGVSKLVIVTAGTDDTSTEINEAKGILDIVDKDIAQNLQQELLRRSDVQRIVTISP